MISDKDLLSELKQFENSVSDYMDSEAASDRAELLTAYLGGKYGNERDGYSQVVTREVYQTVENTVADVGELFLAGDEVIRFEPQSQNDIEAAQQATDYVSYIYFRKNDGFSNTMQTLRDGVLQRFGVLKIWWDEEELREKHSFEGMSLDAFAMLTEDDEVEITEFQEEVDEQGGSSFSGEFVRTITRGRISVEPVASEDFSVHESTICLEHAPYVKQTYRKTRSELLALGFDKEKVDKATGTSQHDNYNSPERQARRFDTHSDQDDLHITQYDVIEEYARIDRDEDDFDELIKVIRVGSQILHVEEVSEHPYLLWTPITIPHKLTGLCPADAAMEIQKVKTTLWRNQLDNQYNLNNGRPVVVEGQVDLDSVYDSKPGAPYVVKHPSALSFPNQPSFGTHTYQMMGLADQMLEMTVGSSDTAIDPNILNGNTAAGAVSQVLSKRQARQRLIAREYGEFMRKVFLRIYELVINYSDDKDIFRLNDRFVEVDPRRWQARKDVSVLVGLGNGSKTEQLFHMQQTFAAQQAMISAGGLGITVLPSQIVQLQEDMVRLYDKAAEGRYFTKPPPEFTGRPEGPSPEEQALQLQAQIQAKELELKEREQDRRDAEFQLQVKEFEADQEFKIAELNLEARQERGVKVGS